MKFKIKLAQPWKIAEGFGIGVIISYDRKLKGLAFIFGNQQLMVGLCDASAEASKEPKK